MSKKDSSSQLLLSLVFQWIQKNGLRCYAPDSKSEVLRGLIFPSTSELASFGASSAAVGIEVFVDRECTRLLAAEEF